MKILNLIENVEGTEGCKAAHGLSFYIETERHKLLLDLGPSADTITNAEILGVKLDSIDTVVLSHGHYDHSGGILPFTKINDHAAIYMQKAAVGNYYADEGPNAEERYRYIGIDPKIPELPQVKMISGNYVIDDELSLYTIPKRSHPVPFANRSILVKQGDAFVHDNFEHEQYLVVSEGGKNVLLSGCAHNGMLSILDEYERLYGADPDIAISGFHLMKKTEYKEEQVREIRETAEALKKRKTRFITCHCTGLPAFEIMKEIMGDQLEYVRSGEPIL